jgi:hypothetical protein
MTAARLLSDVRSQGVQVWVEGSMLRLRARKGVVNSDTIAKISAHKAEIISILTGKAPHQARVRGQESVVQVCDADVCWHCRGSRRCDCALCGRGLQWERKAGQCGACKGTGHLIWTTGVLH